MRLTPYSDRGIVESAIRKQSEARRKLACLQTPTTALPKTSVAGGITAVRLSRSNRP